MAAAHSTALICPPQAILFFPFWLVPGVVYALLSLFVYDLCALKTPFHQV
jgi:hypothetical protein